jgi:hypothetical protein
MDNAFHVGDRVRFSLGRGKLKGVISEDRGKLGLGGRRLYQVLVSMDPSESELTKFELQEDEIESDDRGSETASEALASSRIIAYLKHGGLIAILWKGRQDAGNHPRAWLCRDSLDHVTHTFLKERGELGGAAIPLRASSGDRILKSKRREVSEFLRSFGLDERQASDVISSVGTLAG